MPSVSRLKAIEQSHSTVVVVAVVLRQTSRDLVDV
jgi:hypothetical protein